MLVKELGINRKTFYLHYDSLDELLNELADEIAEEIVLYMQGHQPLFSQSSIEGYLELLSHKLPLHKRLICSPEYLFVFERVSRTIVKRCRKGEERYILEGFLLSAATEAVSLVLMQTYRNWLKAEMPVSSKELAGFLHRMLTGNMIEMLRRK